MIAEKRLITFLTADKKKYSFEESIRIMRKILDALDKLHQKGQLHLALCPEAILLFPDRAVLLTGNELWKEQDRIFYAAPEVRLKNVAEIGPEADVYSACAVFFHLLMQRKMQESEIIGKGLCRCFSADMEVFQEVPKAAVLKTIQILRKGLHTLPRKRYPCASVLLEEVNTLNHLRRIERQTEGL